MPGHMWQETSDEVEESLRQNMAKLRACGLFTERSVNIDLRFKAELIHFTREYKRRNHEDSGFDLTDFDNFFCASVACFMPDENNIEDMLDFTIVSGSPLVFCFALACFDRPVFVIRQKKHARVAGEYERKWKKKKDHGHD